MNTASLFDVIVIGAGPAGTTTATYAARSGLREKRYSSVYSRFARLKKIGAEDYICLHSAGLILYW